MQRRTFLQSSAAMSIASVHAGSGSPIVHADDVPDDDIRKIIGGNVMRVANEAV